MTSTGTSDLCRITVIGPDHKADLAVPMTTSVASLLPAFLRHTADEPTREDSHGVATGAEEDGEAGYGAWVLQRLGGTPFDLEGTPESLEWLEGEQVYLRQAENPLPELEFDDLADGVAGSVEQHWDRWRPGFRRPTFLVLSSIATLVIAAVLASDGDTAARMGGAGLLSALLLAAAVGAASRLGDRTLGLLAGLASCGFAALGGFGWLDGVAGGIHLNTMAIAGASAGLLTAATIAIALHFYRAKMLPIAPFLAVGSAGALAIIGLWLRQGLGLSPAEAAGVTGTLLVGVVIFSPKIVIKAASLRGPQLPKTAGELSFDIEPVPAEDVRAKTANADQYLSVAIGCAALGIVVSSAFLMREPGWAHWTLVILISATILLRSRAFRTVWQRAALALAGSAGAILLTARLWNIATPGWQVVVLLGLLGVFVALIRAALRPPPRRLLPIWEHTANALDTVTALAMLPVVFQVLGLYAWARGLFG